MKKNVFLIVFMVIVFMANAQLPSTAMKTPYKIKTYPTQQTINQISSGDVSNMDMMEAFWNVFSDRNENATYDAPNSKRTKDVLGFLDRVTIAEIRGDWAHIYQETYLQQFPTISKQAKDLGWIKMENLILSDFALKNNNNFTRKAMVLTTLTSGGSVNEEYNRFYSNPELKASKVTPNFAKTFEIYFILKVEGKRCLICKSDKVVGGESEARGSILGWIDEKNLTFWDHRVCLEPSSLPEAIAEYGDKRMLIFAPDKKNSAISFFNGEVPANHIRSLELKSTRADGYTYRLPIIETDPTNNNIVRVGTIGNISERDSREEERLRKKLQDSKNKAQNINILFVIDGTNSMKDYFAPAAQSIARSISQIKARNNQNNLKFGALVYRDYADGKDAAVLKKLTSNHDEVIGFLNGTQCFSKASEVPEAMFNGLIEGVKNCGFRQGESNLVILIGDAGNHVPDPKRKSIEDVLKEMLRFDCNFVAFQVNNGSHRSHDYFNEQARKIMLDNAKNVVQKYGYKGDLIVVRENKNTFKLSIAKEQEVNNDLFIIGRFTFADKGSSINTRELERAIEQTIVDYNELTAKLISDLENVLNTMGGFTDEFKAWMRRSGFTDQEIRRLENMGAVKVDGWMSKKTQGYSNDLVQPVLFLSREEFTSYINTCLEIRRLGTGRSGYQDAFIQQLSRISGDRISKDVVLNYTISQTWEQLFGYVYQDKEIGKLRIRDLTTPTIFTDAMFTRFHQRFNTKLNNVEKFSSTTYPFSFESNNIQYYWVPLEDLP